MASLIINQFMECLLERLHLKLDDKAKKIYKHAVLNPLTPSLIVQYTKVVNASNVFTAKYILHFTINLIFKDTEIIAVPNIIRDILDVTNIDNFQFQKFELRGIRHIETLYKQSDNISTFKHALNFKAMITMVEYV